MKLTGRSKKTSHNRVTNTAPYSTPSVEPRGHFCPYGAVVTALWACIRAWRLSSWGAIIDEQGGILLEHQTCCAVLCCAVLSAAPLACCASHLTHTQGQYYTQVPFLRPKPPGSVCVPAAYSIANAVSREGEGLNLLGCSVSDITHFILLMSDSIKKRYPLPKYKVCQLGYVATYPIIYNRPVLFILQVVL